MSTVQPNYLFLSNPAAADVVVSEGILTIGSGTNITPGAKIKNIKNVYQKTGAAAVNQVVTAVVPTPVVGNNYAFQVTQQNAMGEYVSYYISYQALTTVAADVHAALKSVLDALVASGSLSATIGGASPNLTITGTAANPIVTGEALEGITSVTVTTPGNEAFGLGADLIADGITGISVQPVSGTTYSLFLINYFNEANSLNAQERNVEAQTYVYYNSAGGTVGAFETALANEIFTITTAPEAGAAVSVEKL
jgi:hypothetical protein